MSPSEFFYTVVLKPRPLRLLANAILKRIAREQVDADFKKLVGGEELKPKP